MKVSRLCILCSTTVALSCLGVFSQPQRASDQDACARFQQADTLLNKTYNQVLTEYSKNAAFIRKLKIAQRAWIAYRDAQVEAVYPEPDKRAAYGSVYPMCRCIALAQLTTQRAAELKRWIDGIEEGDVCSGSIKKN
jgi:uncharacterized protein YecT (DUF1311 family)